MPPGPDRWKERSRTFTGIAEAMADQWGALAQEDEQRERIHRAVNCGESMGWKPSYVGEEPNF